MTVIVAGLDIATQTGIAVGPLGGSPKLFSVDLGLEKPHDERFGAMFGLAHTLIRDHGVTHMGLEAPIKHKHDKTATNVLLMGLTAILRGWAYRKGVPVEVFGVATIDKHFLGHRMIGRDERKRAIWGRCTQLGWTPTTQDDADAGAVWDITCAHLSPAYAASNGSLFAGAR